MRPVASILSLLVVAVLGLWLLSAVFNLRSNIVTLFLLAAPVVAVFFILTSHRNTA